MNNNNNTDKHPNPNPSPSQRENVEGSRSLFLDDIGNSGFNCENPKKKRSKLIRIGNDLGASSSRSNNNGYPKQESRKKPEPNIIPPCSECGKQFLSWKALFGHMRCHPERQWRGINPPHNLKKPVRTLNEEQEDLKTNWTNEDQEVATSLLMLANGSIPMESRQSIRFNLEGSSKEAVDYRRERDRAQVLSDRLGLDGVGSSSLNYRFECSSCKKVFGSHQALGGHRASHKNVKGCFAITRKDDSLNSEIELNHESENVDGNEEKDGKMAMGLVHKCEICYKVFCSGQALGGHMRCHFEKDNEHEPLLLGLGPCSASKDDRFWDLNFPSATNTQRNENPSSSTSELGLDLRLGFR